MACRRGQPAARDRLVFCNDRVGERFLEGVAGSGEQQVQPTKAEEQCMRGSIFLVEGDGTDGSACTEDFGSG